MKVPVPVVPLIQTVSLKPASTFCLDVNFPVLELILKRPAEYLELHPNYIPFINYHIGVGQSPFGSLLVKKFVQLADEVTIDFEAT